MRTYIQIGFRIGNTKKTDRTTPIPNQLPIGEPHERETSERELTNSHTTTHLVDHRPHPIIPKNQPRHVH